MEKEQKTGGAVCAHVLQVWNLDGQSFRQKATLGWLRCTLAPGHPRDLGHQAAGRSW